MRESEMEDKGNLSQNKENKIQFFWEWFNINKDKLNEFEPHMRFESLYDHITTSDKIKKFLDKIRGHQKDDLHDTYYS